MFQCDSMATNTHEGGMFDIGRQSVKYIREASDLNASQKQYDFKK